MRLGRALVIAGSLVALSPTAQAGQEIEIVGSSTVFPFTSKVIEKLAAKGMEVELKSTGTRAGFNAFCLGYGDWWPDVTGASRPITEREKRSCAARGVTAITEIKIGFDGMVVARNAAAERIALTREDLYLALAARIPSGDELAENPHESWSAVNPAIPSTPIVVYGPPGSSGTRDSFESLAMSAGCKLANARSPVPEDLSDLTYCKELRGAPQFVEAGEDDAQIVQVLKDNPDALGIFGYSYALANPDDIQALPVDGVVPTPVTIADGSYPLSRALFIYVKNNRLAELPNLKVFLEEYVSDAAIGPEGYLAPAGLVPLSQTEREATRARVQQLLAAGAATD